MRKPRHQQQKHWKPAVNHQRSIQIRGKSRYNLENFQGAVTDLSIYLQQNPEDSEVAYELGNANFRLEQYTEAIASYDKAIANGMSESLLFNNRGKAKTLLDNYSGAIPDFDQALKLDPTNKKARSNRAEAKYAMEDWEGALAGLYSEYSIGATPAWKTICTLVFACSFLGDYEKSISNLNQAITKGATGPEVYRIRGLCKV